MLIGYHDPGWGRVDPQWNPAPPSIDGMHKRLVDELDQVLSHQPIEQQPVYIAVLWDEDDWMVVDIRDAPPDPRTGKEIWCDCLVDFDQYHGTVEAVRRLTAEELADEVMIKQLREFGPWEDDPPDYDDYH